MLTPAGPPVSSSAQHAPLLPFRHIVDAASDGVGIVEVADPTGPTPRLLWRYLNPRGRAVLGLEATDLDRVDVETSSPGLARHGILQQSASPGGGEVSARWELDDGRVLAMRSGTFDGYVVLRFRDVTTGERLEASERESRVQLRAILASIDDAFILLDPFWRISYLNAEAARILQGSPSELLGRNIWEELAFLRGTDFENELLRANRESTDVTFEAQHPIDPDTWLLVRAYPSEVGLTVSLRDVSSNRRMAAHAAEVQRARSLVTLAGGIAHDFNNLLTVLQGYADLVADDLGPDHPSAEHLAKIHGAAERAEDLTRQLLAYSQNQMVLPTQVDLNSVIAESSARLRNRAGASVTVRIELDDTPVTVEVDPQDLVQSLAYLVDNARDAMPDGGDLMIQVTRTSEPITAPALAAVPTGDFGVISLTDTGTGMTSDVSARAIEPFFSHGRHGSRTGMGLSAVDGMARQAGGWLEIDSQAGVGTVVRIVLPCLDSDTDEVRGPTPIAHGESGPAAAAVDQSQPQSILVVDDNTNIRDLLARLLSEQGYIVHAAADGATAVAIATARKAPFDLLVTDIVMPGMSGLELADAIADDERGPAVLFMSGFTDRARLLESKGSTERDFIAKPFTTSEMRVVVECLLTERHRRLEQVDP